MAKLVWGQTGDRLYETGLDRGVLYPKTGPGVPWNGLISIDEQVEGGEGQPLYYDGVKYIDLVQNEDFAAELEAFSSPPEFASADGMKGLAPGLLVTHQRRETFGLAYRTKIGSDVTSDLGYKLHIVYNATASPASRARRTISASVEPQTIKWRIDAVPPSSSLFKPTAHFIVDSRNTHPFVMRQIEDSLYGTATQEPALIPASSLTQLFLGLVDLKIVAIGGGYQIMTTDPEDARAVIHPDKPVDPDISEEPILWLESQDGYVVPKLVTGG